MVKQPDPAHGHDHAVLVARLDDQIVPHRAAGLYDIADAALLGAVDVVAEREKRVRGERHPEKQIDPLVPLFAAKACRAASRKLSCQAILFGRRQILFEQLVDSVVPFGPADALLELQTDHDGVLPQEPLIGLGCGEPRAVDARLLACAHADHLSAERETDRIRLGIFQRDLGQDKVAHALRAECPLLR